MLKPLVTTLALVSLCSGLALAAEKKVVRPKGAEPNAGWSYGILVDDTLYVSGMGGEDAAGKIPASFDAEVKQSLDNINAVLKEAEMTPADVVSVQVYITDGALFDRMNTVYRRTSRIPSPLEPRWWFQSSWALVMWRLRRQRGNRRWQSAWWAQRERARRLATPCTPL